MFRSLWAIVIAVIEVLKVPFFENLYKHVLTLVSNAKKHSF